MSFSFSDQVQQLVDERMATGLYTTTDELLITALHQLSIHEIDEVDDNEVAAIREGIESIERGEPSLPLDEAFAEVRKKHGISQEI